MSLNIRSLSFTPVFLYGQGVTGCTEVSLVTDGQKSALFRLFMRSGVSDRWTYVQLSAAPTAERRFDEEAFFSMLNVMFN